MAFAILPMSALLALTSSSSYPGFVMYLSNSRMNKPIIPFLVGRFFRIVPLYWLSTLVMVAFFYAGYHPHGLNYFEPYMLLPSLLFVTTEFPNGRYDLILSLGWTLIYKLFFYFVFALTFGMRTISGSLGVVGAIFAVLVVLGAIFPLVPTRIGFFLKPIILEFLFGGLLAIAFVKWQLQKRGFPGRSTVAAIVSLTGALAAVFATEACGLGVPGATRAFV